jgi:hypothetical protein
LLINRKVKGNLVKYYARFNVLRLLMSMHHIAFAPHALHILISTHVCAYVIDRVELESGIKKGASLRGTGRSTSVKLGGC